MEKINYPVNIKFKVTTIANDFVATDANGNMIAYVKQKMFKFVDEISVFANETKTQLLYTIKASKWIDFSAAYNFITPNGIEIGKVARKGWASIWKARYEIFDEKGQQDLLIREENGWTKVFDSMLGEIPVLGIFTGYLFNPSYIVTRPNGTPVARLKKQASFLGKSFTITKLNEFETGEDERLLLSLMMMILLERRRG
jgi:uncharacterized protein YxjI